ncbi:MAG TPA: hypothetical protein PLF54_13475, partial [Deltaproteobacteria bacterium]|nr:hypothetical protein [Deltaproteobacteria bacterium]
MRAIGSTSGLSVTMQRTLTPNDDFDPIPVPHPGDWLSVQHEPGQGFDDYVNSRPRLPDNRRRVIYLTPLGEFPPEAGPPLGLLRECAEAYFVMEVRVTKPVKAEHPGLT